MNALILVLAGFLATGIGAPKSPPTDGPVVVATFQVGILDEAKAPIGGNISSEEALIPLPDDLIKSGWLCTTTKRTVTKHRQVLQSIICRYGQEKIPVKVSATAICDLDVPDHDEQRIMIGTDARGLGLIIRCISIRAIGAEI